MEGLICPLTYNDFETLMKKSNESYTKEDIRFLYEANETLKKEKIGGRSKKQLGGVKCLTVYTYYKYSLITLLIFGGIYCGYAKWDGSYDVVNTIQTFVEMCKNTFDAEQFKHIWDVVGKTQLAFSFAERVTKYFFNVVKKPEEGWTAEWMQNLFKLLCEVEEGVEKEKTNIDERLKTIVGKAIEQELQPMPPIPPQQSPKNQNIVYDGKIMTIEMGDAMITISPNTLKLRSSSADYITPPTAKGNTRRKKNKKKKTIGRR